MALAAVIMIAVGLFNIFARDLVWGFARLGHRLDGVYAQRTPTWDGGRLVFGIAMLVLGIALLVGTVNSATSGSVQPAAVAGPIQPYPGAVPYQPGSDAAVEQTIAKLKLSAGELSDIEWYRVPANGDARRTKSQITFYYSDQVHADICSGDSKTLTCNGYGRAVKFRTIVLSQTELLLGVY